MQLGGLLTLALVACIEAKTYTDIKCYTSYGTVSHKHVPTCTEHTKTTTICPVTVQKTKHSTVTVTKEKTSTVTSTSTATATVTALTITDIFSTTSTETDTSIVSTTTTEIDTTTQFSTTTVTTTATVPTPSGFLPIQDTTATAYPNRKRSVISRLQRNTPKGLCHGHSYPQKVDCKETLKIQSTTTVYVQGHKTTITVHERPTTTTVVTTVTSTSTVVPIDITITSSFSTTTTVTDTTTISITSTNTDSETATATVPAATASYAACGASNFLGPAYMGATIDNIYNDGLGASNFNVVASDSAYDCCVACITDGTCEGSGFGGAINSPPSCYLFYPSATPPNCSAQSDNSGFYDYETNPDYSFEVSNGLCGYFYDGGVGF